jgi:hypothetical protein
MPCQNNILSILEGVLLACKVEKSDLFWSPKSPITLQKVKHNAEIYPRLFCSCRRENVEIDAKYKYIHGEWNI